MSLNDLELIQENIRENKNWRKCAPVRNPIKDSLRELEKNVDFKWSDDQSLIELIDALILNKETYEEQMAVGLKYYGETLIKRNQLAQYSAPLFLEYYTKVLSTIAYHSRAYEDSKKYFLEDERALVEKTERYLFKQYHYDINEFAAQYYIGYYSEINKELNDGLSNKLKSILNHSNYSKKEYPLIKEVIHNLFFEKAEHHYLKALCLLKVAIELSSAHNGLYYAIQGGLKKEKCDIQEVKNLISELYQKEITIIDEDINHMNQGVYIAEPIEKNEEEKDYKTIKGLGMKTYEID